MEYYNVLLPLAIILAGSKILSKLFEKINLPSVIGMLTAGILIGLIGYIPGQTILGADSLEGIGFIAKIGVILIMFCAGLDTDIKQIKAIGGVASVITIAGVVLPLGLGFIVATLFNGGFGALTKETAITNLFYGVVLTATSVSVSVATLREMGKLNTRVGNSIVAAAILDDIIGIIVLSFVMALRDTETSVGASPVTVLIKTVLFFVAAFAFGFVFSKIFKLVHQKFPHHRLVPIFSVALCFFFAYMGEKIFGVADITGAFVAGLVLSNNPECKYIERRSDIMSYMIFTPVFFANIGITTKFDSIDTTMLAFGICFIFAGLLGKFLGCGLASLACGFSVRDSVRIGVGMMARAEVALVCAQKGVESGIISSSIMPFIVILIIVSGFITPITLKLSYKNDPSLIAESDTGASAEK